MKKSFIGILLVLAALIVAPMAFAQAAPCDPVYVAGIITEGDHSTTVPGAAVSVSCNGNLQTATSASDGSYAVKYANNETCGCTLTDTATVTATKGSASGSNSGVVNQWLYVEVAVVNVSIPEFGVIAATVAMVGAVGGIIAMRKH